MINASCAALDSVNPTSEKDAESVKIFKERMEKLRAVYNQAKSLFEMFNNMALISSDPSDEKKDVTEASVTAGSLK